MRHWILILLLAGMTGCASQPEDGAETVSNDDEVVCRTDREVGSNFTRRTCKTIAEWREEREANKELTDKMRPGESMPSDVIALPGG